MYPSTFVHTSAPTWVEAHEAKLGRTCDWSPWLGADNNAAAPMSDMGPEDAGVRSGSGALASSGRVDACCPEA